MSFGPFNLTLKDRPHSSGSPKLEIILDDDEQALLTSERIERGSNRLRDAKRVAVESEEIGTFQIFFFQNLYPEFRCGYFNKLGT